MTITFYFFFFKEKIDVGFGGTHPLIEVLGGRGKQIFHAFKTSVVCIVSLGPARDTDRPCVTDVG